MIFSRAKNGARSGLGLSLNDGLRLAALLMGMLASGGNFIFPRIPLLIGIALICFYLKGPSLGLRRAMEPIGVLLVIVLAVVLVGGDGFHLTSTVTRYANFLAALLLLGLYLDLDRHTILRDLYLWGKIFAIQALLTLALSETFNQLFATVDVLETHYRTINYVFTYHVMLEESTAFYRPDGLFYEPGVFQIYLNIFVYLALFVFRNWRWAAVGVLAVLAVQSTTGYLIALLLLGLAFVRYLKDMSFTLKWLAITLAPILAIPLLLVAAQNLQSKFSGVLIGSVWAREYDTYTGLRVLGAHPLFGIGFDYDTYYDEAAKYGYLESQLDRRTLTERPNSNSVVALFYSVGIPLALVFMFGLFRQIIFPDRLIIGAILIMSLFAEALLLTPFFLMIIFSGLLSRRKAAAAPAPRAVPTRAV